MAFSWTIKGEFLLSCNCDLFCPCVVSLGKAKPTQGDCFSWWGIHIQEGRAGRNKLDGLNVAIMLHVPGAMLEGNWTAGLYIDERANKSAADALVKIFSGQAGGPTGWFSIMIGEFLGMKRVPIAFEKRGKGWHLSVPGVIDGGVEPIAGPGGRGRTRISNTAYWVSPEVVVSRGTRSRIRDWGRNWDFSGQSAEYAKVDWAGP